MSLKKSLNKWFTHFKQYFFTYHDGFYELAYLGNSPQSLVESAKKMPFIKFSAERNQIVTKNIFIDGQLQYFEIEEGLWVLNSRVKSKKNSLFRRIYDENLPIDYYFLSFNNNLTNVSCDKLLMNGVEIDNLSWTLYKPKSNDYLAYFQDSIIENFLVCFNENWFENNLKEFVSQDGNFNKFMKDESVIHLSAHRLIQENIFLVENFKRFFESKLEFTSNLKMEASAVIKNFINRINADENYLNSHSHILNKRDLLIVFKIQHYLLKNLDKKFVGIDFLAETFSISPTKLKSDFKVFIGMSIFQYFQQEQMRFAKKILETKSVKVKELAKGLGYENGSKFSAAFFKVNGLLPKYIRKTI